MQTPHVFVTRSHAGKAIRLTEAVWWEKILVSHPELGERNEYVEEVEKTIADAEYLIQGRRGEILALRWCEIAPRRAKYLCVIYKELNDEGFVITAFFESRPERLLRRKILWKKEG